MIDPGAHRILPALLEELVPVCGDQIDRGPEIAGGGGVLDRFVDRPRLGVPGRRSPVQDSHQGRLGAGQLMAQQFREQVVIAVPLASGVQRHDEGVLGLERSQHLVGVGGTGHRGAQRAG
jgi:hypothetical protein